jgi:hypothetical protein
VWYFPEPECSGLSHGYLFFKLLMCTQICRCKFKQLDYSHSKLLVTSLKVDLCSYVWAVWLKVKFASHEIFTLLRCYAA